MPHNPRTARWSGKTPIIPSLLFADFRNPLTGPSAACLGAKEIKMRKYLLASGALLVIATPAAAKDHSGYIGVDIGATWPNSQDLFATGTFSGPVVCNALPPATC